MPIADLQAKQGNVDLIAEVVEKGDIREFEKFGKKGRVCNTKIKDETGTIKLTLWNDDISRINVGDKLHVKNGYVNEWQGEKQLTIGKFGTLEKVDAEESKEESLKNLTETENKIESESKPLETFDDIDKESEDLDEVEKISEKKTELDVKDEIDQLEKKEDIISLDDLEEVKSVKESEKKPVENIHYGDDSSVSDDDFIEEEVVDEE